MQFVAPRADVFAYDIVAGQGTARQVSDRRGASDAREGAGHGMRD